MNVHLFQMSTNRPYQMEVYRRCVPALRDMGVVCHFHMDRAPTHVRGADLLVIQSTCNDDAIEALRQPFIVEERLDGSMPRFRACLHNRYLLRLYRVSVLKRQWINCPVKRFHSWLIDGREDYPDRKLLTDAEVRKIHPGIHFGMFNYLIPWVRRAQAYALDDWAHRPIDVLFIGQVEFSVPALHEHRMAFHAALKQLRGINVVSVAGHQLSMEDYFALSRHAKIIVSPWGYGELCYRDFEALLDRCILVKPQSDFFDMLGDTLRPFQTYIPCKPDASDLGSIVRYCLEHCHLRDPGHRNTNCKEVLHWWNENTIARWWFREISRALESC